MFGKCIAALAAILLCSVLPAGFGQEAVAEQGNKGDPKAATRKAVILSVNDVYQIEGVADSRSGGLARVRALRAELERTAPDMLFLHAGDFLSPSFMGRTYQGAQMIDIMNRMDGNPAPGAFDNRMFVAFGNHEFDDTHCGRDGPLAKLVSDSEFTWLASNLDFGRCERLKALAGHPRIAASRIIESGGLKIGLFSVTLAYPAYRDIVADPIATACRQIEDLRGKGVDAVVALTHLSYRSDLELLGRGVDGKELPAASRKCQHAPDVIIGGHDHNNLALPSAAPQLFKADADAVTAWVVEIEKVGASLRIKGRLVPLDRRREPDRLVQRVTNDWLKKHDEGFCRNDCKGLEGDKAQACLKTAEGGACLKEVYAWAASKLETEEIVNRSFETGFGNWVADQMRASGGADVAFLNAGSIRINYDLPAGTRITRRHLEQMFPFKGKLVIRDVPGSTLWRAMEHAVAQRGEGQWAHFSGMAVQLGAPGSEQRIARIMIRRRDGRVVEIGRDTKETFSVASLGFVLANGDRHGFDLCGGESVVFRCIQALEASTNWPVAGEAADIAGLVRLNMRRGDRRRGLVLTKDRRLCDRGQKNCLIDSWQRARP